MIFKVKGPSTTPQGSWGDGGSGGGEWQGGFLIHHGKIKIVVWGKYF